MTPAPRVQAAIELLDQVIAAARDCGAPADRVIADGLAPAPLCRIEGPPRDPRPRLCRDPRLRPAPGERAGGDAAAGRAGPPVGGAVRRVAITARRWWGRTMCRPKAGSRPIGWKRNWRPRASRATKPRRCSDRAPLDVRVNTLKASRGVLELPVEASRSPRRTGCASPTARRSSNGPPIAKGFVEVQDCGSQLACIAVGAQPGETVDRFVRRAGARPSRWQPRWRTAAR